MSRIEQQLVDLSHQLHVLQTDLTQTQEQYSALDEMAEEANIRALVSETPGSDTDAHDMNTARERLSCVITSMKNDIASLKKKQDELLERLYEVNSPADENG